MEKKHGQLPHEIAAPDMEDVIKRSEGNPSALNVLRRLKARGDDIYNQVAPHLGTGEEIAIKFQIECESDLDRLIQKYRQ